MYLTLKVVETVFGFPLMNWDFAIYSQSMNKGRSAFSFVVK